MSDNKRSSLDENGRVLRLGKFRLCYGQEIGDDDCPFMKRWVLIHDNGAGIRLHHFMPNHYEAVGHDHPFGFLTIVLRGGYKDISLERAGDDITGQEWIVDELRAGSIRWRPAKHLHKTQTDHRGAWTFVINGPKKRLWGFLDQGLSLKWVPWMDYKGKRSACEDVPS